MHDWSTALSTESVVNGHLEALKTGDVDKILADYSEDAVLFHPEGTVKGKAELRPFFEAIAPMLDGLLTDFEIVRLSSDGEVCFLFWKSVATPFSSDTYVVKNGKITAQAIANYMPG